MSRFKPFSQDQDSKIPSSQNFQSQNAPFRPEQTQLGFGQQQSQAPVYESDHNLQSNIDQMEVHFSGVLEGGECEDEESLRIEYAIKYGSDDWIYVKQANDEMEPIGISQLSTSHNLHSKAIVWNFPFECNFQTKNIYGWPQIVVRLSGPDFLGRTVAKGYGSVHIPTKPGYHERKIRIFKPMPTSGFTGLLGALLGNSAELKNFDKVISSGEGREVTRVRSVGYVNAKFNVTLVNFERYGYL